MRGSRGIPERVRFWSFVDNPAAGCWEWTGGTTQFGYGAFRKDGRIQVNAHRYAWELTYGPVPVGLYVLHRCDNPKCLRPDHLFLGTHLENMADARAKGRTRNANTGVTHCKHGHELTGDNLIVRTSGSRTCRTCSIRRKREFRARLVSQEKT